MSTGRAGWIAAGAVWATMLCGSAVACDGCDAICDEVGAAVDAVAGRVERFVEHTLDVAREDVQRTHGLFVYTPGVGNALDENWSDLPALGDARDVVVLVHGLDEPGDVWSDLAPALYDAGHVVLRFDYPNDQAIAPSGAAMHDAMAKLYDAGVRRVDVVAHSMGGLVTREMLTGEQMYAGKAEVEGHPRIASLITVGTPYEGSEFAGLEWVGEIRDQVVRCVERSDCDPRALLGFLYDGRGEASHDLAIRSKYLCALGERPVSGEIALTTILGQALPVDGEAVTDALGDSWVSWAVGEDAIASLGRCADRAADFVGDGVVSVSSACVAATGGETITVRANHRSLLCRSDLVDAVASRLGVAVDDPPAIALILERLASVR